MSPPQPAHSPSPVIVKTWSDLRREVRSLRSFYKQALEVSEDLVTAADLADEDLLARVLTKHGSLRAHSAFKVSAELFNESPLVLN